MKTKSGEYGSFTIRINNKPSSQTELKHPYSASVYKGSKFYSGFRSANPISEDEAFRFFFVDSRRDKGATSLIPL